MPFKGEGGDCVGVRTWGSGVTGREVVGGRGVTG